MNYEIVQNYQNCNILRGKKIRETSTGLVPTHDGQIL